MSDYLRRVLAILTRLTLLIAVLLMPLGMVHAAAASDHTAQATVMADDHCSQGAPGHGGKAAPTDCTMACAAALPAFDQPTLVHVRRVFVRSRPSLVPPLRGVLLDIAPPPPRIG